MKSKILIPLLAGLVLLGACKGVNKSESADTASNPASFEKAIVHQKEDTLQTGPKLVKKPTSILK